MPQVIALRLGHAKYLKAISYAKVKTDAVDPATLAQLLRVELIPEGHMISDANREIRDVLRARLLLVSRTIAADGVSAPCSRSTMWRRRRSCQRCRDSRPSCTPRKPRCS